jgi:hypothetical protein
MFKSPIGLVFSEEFIYMPLAVANLKQIVELVELRFKVRAFGFELKSVRPEKFGDFHNFDVNKIYDAIEKSPDIIRTYHVRFCSQNIGGKALADFASLGIIVTARSKFGDNDENEKKISLEGLNCSEKDFVYFKKAVFEVVKLEKYYPPGTNIYDDILARFIKSDFIDNESKTLITGAISTRQYELAIKAISGLVESALRDKLDSLGVAAAADSGGIELAKLAYNKNNGYLSPPWPIAKESQEGAYLLFSGYILWIRNGFHHQTKIFATKEGILELLTLSCALLRIVNLSAKR